QPGGADHPGCCRCRCRRWSPGSSRSAPVRLAPGTAPAALRLTAAALAFHRLDHGLALGVVGLLVAGPPATEAAEVFPGLLPEQHEIVAGAETRHFEEVIGPAPVAQRQALLQIPDFPHGLGKAPGDGDAVHLV